MMAKDTYRKVRKAARTAKGLGLTRRKGGRALILAARRSVQGAAPARPETAPGAYSRPFKG